MPDHFSPTVVQQPIPVVAFACSKMRVDGFGGMAILITADAIQAKSTHDLLEAFLAARNAGGGA